MNPAKHGSPHAPRFFLPPPLHPPEILKGLKFKQRSLTETTSVSGGGFLTSGVAVAIVDAFAKFKECGFIPKTIT